MQPDQLVVYLKDRADRQAYESIREQIDDSIPTASTRESRTGKRCHAGSIAPTD